MVYPEKYSAFIKPDQLDPWIKDQRSAVHKFAPTVMKFCVMWEGLSLPRDTKFGNCRGEIVDRRMILVYPWSMDQSDLEPAGPVSSFILQSRSTTRPNEFCQLCVSVLEYTARQSVQLVWFLPCASVMVTTGLRLPFSLIELEKYFRPRNWRTQYQYHMKPAW